VVQKMLVAPEQATRVAQNTTIHLEPYRVSGRMPIRITFLNQKGGVGKSTCSALIGSALHHAGYKVAFEDHDPQGSLAMWARNLARLPMVGEVEEPDVVITDTPGRIDLEREGPDGFFRQLVRQSDRLVIVAEKSLFSTQASIAMIELVKAAKREDARAMILFNKVRQNTLIGSQNEEEMARDLGLPVLMNSLPLASAYECLQINGFPGVTGRNRERIFALALEVLR